MADTHPKAYATHYTLPGSKAYATNYTVPCSETGIGTGWLAPRYIPIAHHITALPCSPVDTYYRARQRLLNVVWRRKLDEICERRKDQHKTIMGLLHGGACKSDVQEALVVLKRICEEKKRALDAAVGPI